MRLLFAGTPDVALPSLDALHASRHEVVGVLTRPPAPAGRGRSPRPSPVHVRATELGIPVITASTLRDADTLARVAALAPDCCPVVAFGLDATHQVRSTPARIAAIRARGTPSALAVAQLLEFSSLLPANGPVERGAPLHDPCPIAWLLDPALFELVPCYLEVETGSPLTLGHTAVEFRVETGRKPWIRWAVRADADGVFALLRHRLGPRP